MPAFDARHDTPLTVTVLDTVTGERRTKQTKNGTWFWTEGDGSCDCNRHGDFFPENDRFNGADPCDFLAPGEPYCPGCVRYRIVAVEPMLPGYELADFNAGYPDVPEEHELDYKYEERA
jgi:hypothetical protein